MTVTREYSSAARRAAGPPMPDLDDAGLLAWVAGDPDRARRALAALQALPAPGGGAQEVAAEWQARRDLRERLREVFPSFKVDGEKFWAMGTVQLLDLCEMTKLAKAGVTTADPSGLAALAEFFEGALGSGEYERFRTHTRRQNTDPDLLEEIMEGLMEDMLGRPTSPPSHSVGGRSSTGPTSRVVSLSRRTVTEMPAPPAPESMTPEQFTQWWNGRQRPSPAGEATPPDGPAAEEVPGLAARMRAYEGAPALGVPPQHPGRESESVYFG